MHNFIRKYLTQVSSEVSLPARKNYSQKVSQQTRVIYGGSVTEKNAGELAKQEDIDGFLVGGAALKAGFKDIVDAFSKV